MDIADESGAEQNSSKPESWEMVFAEEEPTAENEAVEDEDENTHTVLLWSSGMSEASRRLIAEESTQMSITIAYYPFLIGKQDGLVDHVIAEETVSRLHVRIDHKGEEYWLTDLNSTNGTIVNGKRLNANETVPLTVGDLVEIANLRYRFQ